MSLQEFLHVMGLPVSDPADSPAEDPIARLGEKSARLNEKLQHLYRAMLQRRLRIERLRQEIKGHKIPLATSCLERTRERIEKHEAHYQRLLSIFGLTKQRIYRVEARIRAMKPARS